MIKALTVFESPYLKKRYGKNNDGGYILAGGLKYDCFLSAGIGNDLSFENDIMSRYSFKQAHIFDGTSLFKQEEIGNLQFHKVNIGTLNTETHTNLHELISKHENILLKMDIEGYECGWLDTLTASMLSRFRQIVIEFHGFVKSIPYVIQINETHKLIHLHGNNYGGTIDIDGKIYPNVFECTFLNNHLCEVIKPNKQRLPIANLDQPNNAVQNDIDLNFYPFVNL